MQIKTQRTLQKSFLIYFPLFIATIWTLFPLYWTLVTSLKTSGQILSKPVTFLPFPATFEHYVKAWNIGGFSRYFLNSMFVSSISMIFTVAFATMAGYAMARYRFRGKRIFLLLLLCTQFIPTAMLIIPLFMEPISKQHLQSADMNKYTYATGT